MVELNQLMEIMMATNKKAPALKATVAMCKALALALDAQWMEYDKETSKLMSAMADYVTKYGE